MQEEPTLSVAKENWLLSLICSAHFFSHFFTLILPPLYLLIKADYDVDFFRLALIYTVFSTGSAAAQYPMGILSDKIGPKWLVICGLTVLASSVVLMGFTTAYWQLLPLALLGGLGDSVFHPANYSILSARIRQSRMGRAFSAHAFSGFAGFAAAPVCGVLVATWWGWQNALIFWGCVGLAVAALIALNRGLISTDSEPSMAPSAHGAPQPEMTALSMFKSVPILLIFGFYVTMGIGGQGITQFSPSALPILFDISELAGGRTVTIFMLGTSIGILCGGWVADKVGRVELVTIVSYFLTIVMALSIATTLLPFVLVEAALFIAGYFYGLVMPSRDLLVRAVAPKGATGKAFGFVNTGYGIAGAVAPLIYGLVMDSGRLYGIYIGAALFFGIAALFALAASQYMRSPSTSTATA